MAGEIGVTGSSIFPLSVPDPVGTPLLEFDRSRSSSKCHRDLDRVWCPVVPPQLPAVPRRHPKQKWVDPISALY